MLKRILVLLLSFLMTLLSLGLSFITNDEGEGFLIPAMPAGVWEGNTLRFNGKTISAEAEKGLPVQGADLPAYTFEDELALRFSDTVKKTFNYYGLSLKSNVPLKGKIEYEGLGFSTSENFFVEAAGEEPVNFYSFIDGCLDRRKANKVTAVSFENLGDEPAQLVFCGMAVFNRKVLPDTLFIENDEYKLGLSMRWGGALSYLEHLSGNVQAVRLGDDVFVGENALARYGGKLITDEVNLINRCDTGRLVQQSYYGTRGVNDGYIQGEFMGHPWPYNPVQGGNKYGGESKIVDCIVGENSLYIKCRPMDWGKDNEAITPSYMEASYVLMPGYVKVNCRFTDFSRYESVYNTQELPAFYAIEPLTSFRYYGGNSPWTGDPEIKREDELIFWPDAGYPNFNATEYWCAWTNMEENGYGIGMYVPGISKMLAGVADRGGKIGKDPSRSGPTTYVAAVKALAIKSFVPLEYGYLISAGEIDTIRQTFINNKDAVDNTALNNY